jgi:hypothetical protein
VSSSQIAGLAPAGSNAPQEPKLPTWESWGRPLLASEPGRAALEMLRWFFGSDYVQLQAERRGAALWRGDLCPLGGETRVIRVLELASRIAAIREQPGVGRLREEASKDRQGGYFGHLQALLAVAAPLSAAGWRVDLAPCALPGSVKRPDLRASRANMTFCVEVKHLGYDQAIRKTNDFRDRLFLRKVALESRLGRGLTITGATVCDADELDAWAERVEAAAAIDETVINGPGAGQTQILTSHESGPVNGARLDGDLWGRVGMGIQRAARQLAAEHRAWAMIEDAGAVAWATSWSKQHLVAKLDSLISPIRRELAAAPHVAGVVFTTGPRNVGQPVLEQTVWSDGCMATRRELLGARERETFIVRRVGLHLPRRGIEGILGHDDAVALYHAFNGEGLTQGFAQQYLDPVRGPTARAIDVIERY